MTIDGWGCPTIACLWWTYPCLINLLTLLLAGMMGEGGLTLGARRREILTHHLACRSHKTIGARGGRARDGKSWNVVCAVMDTTAQYLLLFFFLCAGSYVRKTFGAMVWRKGGDLALFSGK